MNLHYVRRENAVSERSEFMHIYNLKGYVSAKCQMEQKIIYSAHKF